MKKYLFVWDGYVHFDLFMESSLFPPIKMEARVPAYINHTGFKDNWLESDQWGCGFCSPNLWRCICSEWCLDWKPGTLPSATSICYACVCCYAHFLILALVGTCSTLSACTWFSQICFRKYTQSFQSLCWLTGGPFECFPLESLELSSRKCTTETTRRLLKDQNLLLNLMQLLCDDPLENVFSFCLEANCSTFWWTVNWWEKIGRHSS